MSDDTPIVSHVANQAYREHIDEMTCSFPGCKRWRVDERTKGCMEHDEHVRRVQELVKRSPES